MTTVPSPRFGGLLKRYREAAGWTQEELAERACISARAISTLERGVNRVPRKGTLAALIAALQLAERDRAALVAAARRRGPPAAPCPEAANSSDVAGAHVGGATVPLVGRSRDLAVLARHLAGEGPPLLLLVGEPGIGKSRLLHEAVGLARGSGWCVLEGGCHRRSRQEPYAPVLGALESRISERPRALLRRDLHGCDWLVRLLPELADMRVAPELERSLPPDQERRLIFRAVARFLANIAGPSGTLLVLDDLHWAGSDGLDLLDSLAREAFHLGLRVVGAYRSTDASASESFATALADLAHAGLVAQLELRPLSYEDASVLLARLLPEMHEQARAERVLKRAGGVPFFVVSCAQSLNAGALGSGAVDGVPWDVAQSIHQRVAALPALSQELLGVAAVAGKRVARPLLVAMGVRLRHGKEEVLAALDAACQARLMVEEGDDAYQFGHDLIHDAVETALGTAQRVMLHLRVAQVLERSPGDPPVEQLAYHYLRAGNGHKAALYLKRAGDRAMAVRAYSAAESRYRELVEQLEARHSAVAAAAAREKLGEVLMLLARYDEALTVLECALATYQVGGDYEGVARAAAQIGSAYALRGMPEAGVARLCPLAVSLRESQIADRSLAALHVALAWLINATGRYSEALATAEQAAHLARLADDTPLLAQAEVRRGQLLLMLGQLEQGAEVLEEALPLVEASGDVRGMRLALNSLGWVHEAWGEFEQDRLYTERAVKMAERLGDPTVIAFMCGNRGGPAFNLGEWVAARVDYERALALMRQVTASWASAWPPLLLGQLCLAEGRSEEAFAYLRDATLLAEQIGDLQALRSAQSTLAERDLLEGRPESARTLLEPLLDRPNQEESDVTKLLPLLAWTHLSLGDPDRAAALVAQAIARATAHNMRPVLVDALRVEALLALGLGDGARTGARADWDAATHALDHAVVLSRALPSPYGEAKALYTYGVLHVRKGEDHLAIERLQAALVIFGRLGERLYAVHAERQLMGLTTR